MTKSDRLTGGRHSTLEGKDISNATEIISTALSRSGVAYDFVKDCKLKEITDSDAVIIVEKLDVSVLDATRVEIENLLAYKVSVDGIVYA